MQNLVKICSRGLPHEQVRYNACVTFCTFPSLFSLSSSTGKTTELILTLDGSYDAVLHKEVPFGGYRI